MKLYPVRLFMTMYCKDSRHSMLKGLAFYSIALCILLFFCLLLPSMIYSTVSSLALSKYDYQISSITDEEAASLKSSEAIKEVACSRGLRTIAHTDSAKIEMLINFFDNTDDIDITPFSPTFLISGSVDALSASDKALVIDQKTAQSLLLGVGESLSLGFGEGDADLVEFKVAGISEPSRMSPPTGFGLYTQAVDQAWRDAHEAKPLNTSMAWLTVNNNQKAQKLLWDDFRKSLYRSKGFDDQKISQVNHQYNQSRVAALDEAYTSLATLPAIAYAISVLGAVCLIAFVVRESGKGLLSHRRELAVSSALGSPALIPTLAYLFYSALSFLPALILSAIIVKLVFYRSILTSVYLPTKLLLLVCLITLFLYLLSVVISFLISLRRLSHTRLVTSLSEE